MKNPVQPPRLAVRIFEWYCGYAQIEDLQGDIDELFFSNLKKMSPAKAKLKYWSQVLSLIFSYALKSRKRNAAHHAFAGSDSFAMLNNYFKVATRSLAKQRFFTIINVLGLAIGMSFTLLLVAMISYVSTYDTFHTNRERIYRVISHASQTGIDDRDYATAPPPLAENLKKDITGIEKVVRINRTLNAEMQDPASPVKIPLNGYFVDPEFLDVFTFPLIKGNPATALSKQHSIIITEEASKKIFGHDEPIGKFIEMGDYGLCEVTGLMKDHPRNSHMRFEVLCSYSTLEAKQRDHNPAEWSEYNGNYIYLLMSEEARPDQVIDFMNQIGSKIYQTNADFKASFDLQSLNDIVPGPALYQQIGPDWDLTILTVFFVLTLLILLPACFNYANISIARALRRAKEIGLRKVVGGQRSQIFLQFITETVIISMLSLLGAYGLFVVLRPEFVSMLVASEALDLSTNLTMIVYFVIFALLVGFLAGGIPAIYFSKLNPVQALKNSMPVKSLRGFSFRKVMTVFQFALSLGFIMGVVILFKQYRSSLNYNFGFQQENILNIELQDVNSQVLKNEFGKIADVQSISMSSGVIGTYVSGSTWVSKSDEVDSLEVFQLFIDQNYLGNHNLTLAAGKAFEENTISKDQVIVNETFLKHFQTNAPQALGETFNVHGYGDVTVIGIIKDFHFHPLREPIRSFFFRYDPSQFAFANLKIASSDVESTFKQMEASWKKLEPDAALKCRFLDEEIQEAYSVYFTVIKICGFLALLAICISCLGLLGMVVYTAETRTKEVGIRKVMGATTGQLALLLSKGYIQLVMIAAVIAIPIAYVIYSALLESMQHYNTGIGIIEIVMSLVILLLLGLATIMSQTIRTARTNPVDTLRYE
jgi:putative ABC transport system permease protein